MTPFEAVQIIESDVDDSIDMQDVVEAVQVLIDTGTIYHLQGSYIRLAQDMLNDGLVTSLFNHI